MSPTHSIDEKRESTEPTSVPTLNKDVEGAGAVLPIQDAGVTRIEAFYMVFAAGSWQLWMLFVSFFFIIYAYTLSSSTTYTYASYATSAFGEHAFIGTISVVVSLMSGVAKPFIGKMADIAGRPYTILMALVFYAIGYIITAAAPTIQAVAAGQVIYTVGNTGFDILTTIIIGDMTSLQWRGVVNGVTSLPYVVNAFVAGYITDGISANTADGWRWGYGMFAIMIPGTIAPALVILLWGDRKAKKMGAPSSWDTAYAQHNGSILKLVLHYWTLIDGFGLILFAMAWCLFLLPFTLYTTAENGWKNPSIIAMLTVGSILMIVFPLYEFYVAAHPIMPRRVMNRSMVCAIVIDFMYYLSGYVSDTYFSSWVYVIKDWSLQDYTYFSNTETVGLCAFGVLAGYIQRYTHRYKYLQLSGLCIRIVAMGLNFLAVNGNSSTGVLVASRALIGLGGSFSVIGSQVASQGSVPHQDLALVVSLLALWTSVGGAIGSAISSAVWNAKLPANLDKYLSGTLNQTQIDEIFGSIVVARAAEPRDLVIKAYNDTAYVLFLPALILSFVPLLAGLMTRNFYLGDTQNSIESKVVRLRPANELPAELPVSENGIVEKA